MSENKKNLVVIDKTNELFARAVKICSLVGLVVMIIFGLLYMAGVNPSLDNSQVYRHWDKTASQFWQEIAGNEMNNYSWFLLTLGHMDSLSMIGISLLAVTPLVGVLLMIPRSRKAYKILCIILATEFFYSIVHPYI